MSEGAGLSVSPNEKRHRASPGYVVCACAHVCVCLSVSRVCVFDGGGGGWRVEKQRRAAGPAAPCQRKRWSEESANRAEGMSPETRII